ncbi:PqqD family protein [Erythrobacter litoralis]|uniref:PqqD family protein n=1 Tax=Erythrobacter litoralis (strain HTCC2594) TaxID=314225 RepID=Q2N6T8_ERYLH|nr:PqqD family protein [Erythrobacter litoralis]ABC64603.1 hypothetical protein ELI_12555 [Erythrobacter litoralis HTCC2594]
MSAIEKCTSAFIETDVDDEVVIVGLDDGKFFSLKGTGQTIWKLIDGKRDRAAILDRLEDEFDAPRETLARDLDVFLGEIASAGFIQQFTA